VPILLKIDQEMRLRVCADGYTHRDLQMQTGFIICPMPYAIAIEQIKIHSVFHK